MKHFFPATQRLATLPAHFPDRSNADRSLEHEHEHATYGLLFGAVLGSLMWIASVATFLSMRA